MEKNNTTFYIVIFLVIGLGFGTILFAFRDKPKEPTWVEVQASPESNTDLPQTHDTKVTIYISGAVRHPGVYAVDPKNRIQTILQEAGGITDLADLDRVNLAAFPKDGQHIRVPQKAVASLHKKQNHPAKKRTSKTKQKQKEPQAEKNSESFRKRAFHYSTY